MRPWKENALDAKGSLGSECQECLLITGATGFIGSRLATLAMGRGHRVRTLTRAEWAGPPFVPLDQRCFGAFPFGIPRAALTGVSAVVHCAAIADADIQHSYAVNVRGTLTLARMAIAAGVRAFVFLTSQSARPDAASPYGRTKYEAEQALLALDGIHVVILRPGLVCGPGNRGVYHQLRQSMRSMPVSPLVAGLDPPVQPIHIDDLCEAIFRSIKRSGELSHIVLNLGDPRGVPFSEFVQMLGEIESGRRTRTVAIPLGIIERAVAWSERFGVPLPVKSSNLQGMKTAVKMDTLSDMNRIGLQAASVHEILRRSVDPVPQEEPRLGSRPVRALLVGVGRIGTVHAVMLGRQPGLSLVGVVDTSPKARALLAGLGIRARAYASLEAAITATRPDVVVIATPPVTHLPITTACLARGLQVFVEKPLGLKENELAAYSRLTASHPDQFIQVGYLLPQAPHVRNLLQRLVAEEFGTVKGFVGLTLLSLIEAAGTRRWETDPDISGGGVMMNSGCHVVSMIRAALGDPIAVAAQAMRTYSAAVEDSMVVTCAYPNYHGVHYASWSVSGFPRPENRLIIATDQGRLILTGSVGAFVHSNGCVEIVHHLDFDSPRDVLSDIGGGGFCAQMDALRRGVTDRIPPAMDHRVAQAIERLIHAAYRSALYTEKFSVDIDPVGVLDEPKGQGSPTLKTALRPPERAGPQTLVLDLRDHTPVVIAKFLRASEDSRRWARFLVLPTALPILPDSLRSSDRLWVTAPDFLAYSRLIAAGGAWAALRSMGRHGTLVAGLTVLPLILGQRGVTFWTGVKGLLAAAIAMLPRSFRGTILLHGYVTDLALGLGRLDLLRGLLTLIRRRRPNAKVGFHSGLAPEAANAIASLPDVMDVVSLVSSPGAMDMPDVIGLIRWEGKQILTSAEVGAAPAVVHRVAAHEPQFWAHGADAVVIGGVADEVLARLVHDDIAEKWSRAFPGITFPKVAL